MNKIVIKKFSDIGTGTPWVARCMLQIMTLRDYAITDKELKNEFDKIHNKILINLHSAYKSKEDLLQTLNKHVKDFHDKKIYREDGNAVHIEETIDGKINDLYSNFIIKLHTAVKDNQKILKLLGCNIGFFYQKDSKYEEGKKLYLSEFPNKNGLITMLDSDRLWYNQLSGVRNDYNHNGFTLEQLQYNFNPNIIGVPGEIQDIEILWDNSWKFIEDTIILSLKDLLPDYLDIIIIPKENRDPNNQIKYIINLNIPINSTNND